MKSTATILSILPLLLTIGEITAQDEDADRWAVLVDTSRYFFNYRHTSDVMAMYQNLREAGLPDSRIVVMIADDASCNPRNPMPGQLYLNSSHKHNLLRCDQWVDYRGRDVTPRTLLDVLTGWDGDSDTAPILNTGPNSNVFIYMNGHSGDQFFKFHDTMELSSQDFGTAIADMAILRRYRELLVMWDTCEASTMWEGLPLEVPTRSSVIEERSQNQESWLEYLSRSVEEALQTLVNLLTEDDGRDNINNEVTHRPRVPSRMQVNLTGLGTSNRGENSYAEGFDPIIGLALRDGFAKGTYAYFRERILPTVIQLREQHGDMSKLERPTHTVLDWLSSAGPVDFSTGVLGVRTDLSRDERRSDSSRREMYAGSTKGINEDIKGLLNRTGLDEFWFGWGETEVTLSYD
eukprot:gb/GECG01015040.1/.p1 GENE.gb/GECG01015040.1/~~gb/GECG01015040.1/.p1  ORF type:complete len:406 (+),score=32.47 gb/GECG01015040.1/:1-1218(+)